MKYLFAICAICSIIVLSGVYVLEVSAQQKTVPTTGTPCSPTSGKLCNPLKYENVQQLLPKLLDIVAQIGLIICTFFIIYAGFKYVTAQGDVKAIETAHSILLWSVIGTAVLLGAKVLASILSNTVNQLIK